MRLKQLQTTIDILPDEAQVARLELFHRGFDFETTLSDSGLACVTLGGPFVATEHANLLTRYVVAVAMSDHAELAKPVWHFLAKAIGVPVSSGDVFSDIEHFIEHHPKEFEANHQLKAALTSVDTRACRIGIATMANSVRGRMEAIPFAHRASNQARALVQAKLLLGSFTNVFQELFENDPVGACWVARTLMQHKHDGLSVACTTAILLAVKANCLERLSTAQRRDLYSAADPLLKRLNGGTWRLLSAILSPDSVVDNGHLLSAMTAIESAMARPEAGNKKILEELTSRLNDGFKKV